MKRVGAASTLSIVIVLSIWACGGGDSSSGTTNSDGGNGDGNVVCGNTQTDPMNCGTCGKVCSSTVANSKAVCVGGSCGTACNDGYGLSGGSCVLIPTPRPLAPLSGSDATSQTPTVHVDLGAATAAIAEFCSTADCTTVLAQATFGADGTAHPGAALAATGDRFVFWRARGTMGTQGGADYALGNPSPVWELRIPAKTLAKDVAWGAAGDFNRDGLRDAVIAAPNGTAPAVYVFAGGSGVPSAPTTTLSSPAGAQSFGAAVANVGDLDGDGFPDLAVGAPGASSGTVYLYFGGASGLATTPGASITLANGGFGLWIAPAGDVTHDGYADLAIATAGSAFIYYGRANLATAGALSSNDTQVQPTGAVGAGDEFGAAMSGVCDLNADGYSDLVLGSPGRGAGSVFVALGGASGLASPTEITGAMVGLSTSGSRVGQSVACALDGDGDGYGDILAGASSAASGDGQVVWIPGSSTGPNLANLVRLGYPGSAGANGQFGRAIAILGDVDLDGTWDFAATTPSVSTTGEADVFLGAATTGYFTALQSPTGSAGVGFGASLAHGDFESAAHGDFLVGTPAAASGAGGAVPFVWDTGTSKFAAATAIAAPNGSQSFGAAGAP